MLGFCGSASGTAAGLVLLRRVQSRELESNEAFEFFERTLSFLFGGNGF